MKEHTIDAAGKKLGRVASAAALMLRGKDSAHFTPNRMPDTTVRIVNAEKVLFSEKKLRSTTYTRYSGYPGGFKTESLKLFIKRRGIPELFRKVVSGMLPKNKLRDRFLKRLKVEA